MLDELDHSIIKELRRNSRTSSKHIARKLGWHTMKVSRRIKHLHTSGVIQPKTLLHLHKLTSVRVFYVLRVASVVDTLLFLTRHPRVNSISKIANHHNIFCDAVFKTMKERYQFSQELRSFDPDKITEHVVLEELAVEQFKEE